MRDSVAEGPGAFCGVGRPWTTFRRRISLPFRATVLVVVALATAAPAAAQLPSSGGLPAHAPINPSSARRTALFAAPVLERGGGWRASLALDYGSAIEAAPLREDGTRYLFDAELMRLELDLAHDIGAASFVALSVQAGGVSDGAIDGALDWIHERVGYHMQGRATRPRNLFADSLVLPDGRSLTHDKAPLYFGDARLTLGRRHGDARQTLLSVTLPTSTGPEGSGRGVAAVAVIHSLRAPLGSRWVYEGSAGVGYTPPRGALSDVQRAWLASASSGVRVRLWENHALYYFIFFHSPYYSGTGVPELEGTELSQDIGWVTRTSGGREWRFGLTEDVVPNDQALDVVFKIGASW